MSAAPRSQGKPHRYPVILLPEAEGGYSVWAATLPGVVSQGNTEAEALANIREALEGALQTYQELGESIPWAAEPEPAAAGAETRWIEVHG